jgi:hypothetical protein
MAAGSDEPSVLRRAEKSAIQVAKMLQGISGTLRKCSEIKENKLQHVATRTADEIGPKSLILLVAEDGFEPPTHGL